MKIKYKNFEIEEDRNWFILREIWITSEFNKITWEKNKLAWEERVIDECYPSTLEKAIEKMLHRMRWSKSDVVELSEYIKLIKLDREELWIKK